MSVFSVTDASEVFLLTDTAADKVRSLIEAEDTTDELSLRVAVRPGGCSGYSYEMFFDADVADDDVRSEHGGVHVVIDPARCWHTRPAPPAAPSTVGSIAPGGADPRTGARAGRAEAREEDRAQGDQEAGHEEEGRQAAAREEEGRQTAPREAQGRPQDHQEAGDAQDRQAAHGQEGHPSPGEAQGDQAQGDQAQGDEEARHEAQGRQAAS